jgi:hypothetical protein
MYLIGISVSVCIHIWIQAQIEKKIENNNNKKKVFDRRISICMHPYMDTSTNRNIKAGMHAHIACRHAHTYSNIKADMHTHTQI